MAPVVCGEEDQKNAKTETGISTEDTCSIKHGNTCTDTHLAGIDVT